MDSDVLFRKKFGENFKSARKKARLTQQETADALGVERSLIAKYENGTAAPNLSKLPQICRLLEMTAEQILPSENE